MRMLLLIITIWMGYGVQGQQPMVRLDSTSFLIGDQTALRLTFTSETPIGDLAIIEGGLDTTEAISLLSTKPLTYQENQGTYTYQRDYIIAFFDTGQLVIPPLTMVWEEQDGRTQQATSRFIPILVSPPDQLDEELRPIKPILRLTYDWTDWLKKFVLGHLLLVALLLALVIYFTRRNKRTSVKAEVPVIVVPPYQLAIEALSQLSAVHSADDQEKIKTHFSSLSGIIRRYLEGAWSIPAMESTTSEIQKDMEGADTLGPSYAESVASWLRDIDFIKYARRQPTSEQCDQSVHRTRVIIELLHHESLSQSTAEDE